MDHHSSHEMQEVEKVIFVDISLKTTISNVSYDFLHNFSTTHEFLPIYGFSPIKNHLKDVGKYNS